MKGTGVAVATGLAAFVALGAVGGAWLVERTLTWEAAQVLADQGVEATVAFSGQSAVVSTEPDQLAKALQLVKELPGVTMAVAGDGDADGDFSSSAKSSPTHSANAEIQASPSVITPTPSASPSPEPTPEPSPEPTEMPRLVIQFEGGEATLPSSQRGKITQMAEWLKANPEALVQVLGHTDDGKTESFRKELSRERAQSVIEALVDGGARSDQLVPVARGAKDPAQSNATAEGRTANRRVTFTQQEEG